MKTLIVIAAILLAPLNGSVLADPRVVAPTPATLDYFFPSNGEQFVPPGTTFSVRLNGPIDPATLTPALFNLVGGTSGPHAGQVRLAADGATVVFQPNKPFAPGESVSVAIQAGLANETGQVFAGLNSQFSISPGGASLSAADWQGLDGDVAPAALAPFTLSGPAQASSVAMQPQDDVTFPDDFPAYTVTVPASGTAPGSLFLAPFNLSNNRNFISIMDDAGEPIFWQASSGVALDFKRQPDGNLSYFDSADSRFHVLDNTYTEIKTIAAANGYTADGHDLQILPNGDALLLIYDPQIVDTTQIITSGGYTTATVIGLVIQELDPSGLPVFQWDSWSHFLITDTNVPLNTPTVDYVHGNAIERDYDGNLLLSSRHLSEITKIGRDGHIIWRLGGKNNQFTIVDDSEYPFACQHDIRRLANGNITLFDNHNSSPCTSAGTFSRAVEYQIDEITKVVTNTWQYHNSPDVFGPATGNNQRLPDGHRLIDWGITHPNVSEVLTDNTKIFEMTFSPTYFTYRAFRFPWAALPGWAPTLVLTDSLALTSTLYYSWNGATDVASYEIYGGFGPQPGTLLGTQPRTGFEDHTVLGDTPLSFCSFRVRPINHAAQPQAFSNVVYRSLPCDGFSDVGVTKSVNGGAAQPGQTVTYTLVYSNAGPGIVPSVNLTDILPANLVAVTYTSSGAALTPVGPGPYAWQTADLAPGAGGVITVTGVLSGGLHGSVFTNTASITMDYTDTNAANNTSLAGVTVSNVAPVAADDVYATVGSTTFTVTAPGVLLNDSDANNDGLTATLSAAPLTGTLGLNANGSFSFTPPPNFTGPITFTYQARDGLLLSVPSVVTITVAAYRFFLPIVYR